MYGKNVELKTKISSWGRLHDANKMQYDMATLRNSFSQIGITDATLTAVQWCVIRDRLNRHDRRNLCKLIVDCLFNSVLDCEKIKLVHALYSGSLPDIKRKWGLLAFSNYKSITKFDAILFYNIPTGQTNYVTDLSTVNFVVEAPQIYGSEMCAMPKVGITEVSNEN